MNIIEELRKQSVVELFGLRSFNSTWATWKNGILSFAPALTSTQVLNIGDHLSEVFQSTNTAGRSQSSVSGGGAAWEALVCWYLNLCLIGRRTVVIKHKKELIPEPVRDAITVNYNNFVSNTESDLVAITFPDRAEYINPIESLTDVRDTDGNIVSPRVGTRNPKANVKGLLDALSSRDFNDIEIHIIQCKTNWNDNAQIPMLWDMVYSAQTFRRGITIGKNGYRINNNRFSYSFVTVPSGHDVIVPTATQVMRVCNLSGGNYWGKPSVNSVAKSIKELPNQVLGAGHTQPIRTTLTAELLQLRTAYNYFQL